MRWFARRALMAAAVGGVSLMTGEARAQVRRAPAPVPIPNPYTNPYTNPYLNPALTTGSMGRNDALLYLWAAQQQPGGLLATRGQTPAASAPEVEVPGGAMRPGGNAAHYFGRSPAPARHAVDNRYNRLNRYYPKIGR